MHEFVYADRILSTVLDQMKRDGRKKLTEVRVEVGEFLDLSNESLNMAYGILSKDTRAAGSKLKVKITSGSVSCSKCGFAGKVKPKGGHVVDPVLSCPECGSPLSIQSGNQVSILEIA